MGGAMAGWLATQDFELQVFDLDAAAVAAVVAKGAAAAESGAALAASCEHISICVPNDEIVMDVVVGENGILESCTPGTTIGIHSTVHPDTVRDVAALAAERDVIAFDAAVAGGTHNADQGNLSIMVGIPEGGLPPVARAVVDSCGGAVFDAGPVGAGMAMKVAFNVMTYFQQAAASAAHQIVVGEQADPEQLLAAWRHIGQLGSLTEMFWSVVTMPEEAKAGDSGAYFRGTIGLAEKDLDLAASLGRETGRPMPVVETVRDSMDLVYGMPVVDEQEG
ncbi:MAG: oxidoreductase [Acidimicrobiales bacterium]|nr:MAG: oxidoreductase [Acidimicrobiales bacterium]